MMLVPTLSIRSTIGCTLDTALVHTKAHPCVQAVLSIVQRMMQRDVKQKQRTVKVVKYEVTVDRSSSNIDLHLEYEGASGNKVTVKIWDNLCGECGVAIVELQLEMGKRAADSGTFYELREAIAPYVKQTRVCKLEPCMAKLQFNRH